ncbi:MAG: hypothetical protein KC443_06515 [Anaerolineales bacterium]|nr:hypothetical protein [Anaerolineales bacterium]
MKLYRDAIFFGDLHDYQYETPWAFARLTAADAAEHAVCCRVSRLLNEVIEDDALWEGLSAEEEEALYAQQLAALDLTETAVAAYRNAHWEIRAAERADWNGAITIYEFETDGWIRWRW